MPGTLLLAMRYIAYNRARTAILIAAISITFFLPLATHWTIGKFQERALARARTTPLIVGAKGSRFGLAIHALYFRGESPAGITQAELQRIESSGLARPIPLLVRFRARGYPIVGTSSAYFEYRGLAIERGTALQRLGDCVLGANAARSLGLEPGARLLTEPDSPFDLSGPSPLNMRVTGVLRPTGNADDEIVLCDLKTAWLIQGVGHGHTLKKSAQESAQSSSEHPHDASRENMPQYTEVTDENVRSFHFHGQPNDFPLTAIIAVPESEKSEAILIGKYLAAEERCQIIRSVEVMDELLEIISHVRQLVDLGMLLLSLATALLVGLVLALSIRLRRREMRTMYWIGCGRWAIARIIATELALIVAVSACLAIALAAAATSMSDIVVEVLASRRLEDTS